jgi:CDP-4-dehydro-6-deoxyglucose reductase, E3
MLPPTFEARLVRTRQLTPAVRELTFQRADGVPFDFVAGQWVNLILPLEGELRRAYSIASPPDGTPGFELAITRVEGGPGSTYLHALEVGASMQVQGPQGFFTRAAATPSLFIGTGTGITPLRSMIRSALTSGDTSPMILVFGVRTEEDILYRDELEGLAAKFPNFRFVPTLSRAAPGWTGKTGYVQTHVEELWKQLGDTPHAYICGLQKMVGAVRDLLRKQMVVTRQQVHSERYD